MARWLSKLEESFAKCQAIIQGGSGHKHNMDIQVPFWKELRKQMGLGP
ncbi:hypothetical protein [Sporisorium scitamineum]|uniref:Uncharacterized protein n=1 Tax=Sporisorium scitamineum TaxID=49012 RepID=A0A0F7S733_9BASI|nr:hypothetical protein [Sporisorium scitamineum]